MVSQIRHHDINVYVTRNIEWASGMMMVDTNGQFNITNTDHQY
jgi:hypothetical protein